MLNNLIWFLIALTLLVVARPAARFIGHAIDREMAYEQRKLDQEIPPAFRAENFQKKP